MSVFFIYIFNSEGIFEIQFFLEYILPGLKEMSFKYLYYIVSFNYFKE